MLDYEITLYQSIFSFLKVLSYSEITQLLFITNIYLVQKYPTLIIEYHSIQKKIIF